MQKETAGLLSQLAVELNELGKTLDLLSTASTDLTNVSSLGTTVKNAQIVIEVSKLIILPSFVTKTTFGYPLPWVKVHF